MIVGSFRQENGKVILGDAGGEPVAIVDPASLLSLLQVTLCAIKNEPTPNQLELARKICKAWLP